MRILGVLVLLAACSDPAGTGANPDAPGGDAGSDGRADDAVSPDGPERGLARVTVLKQDFNLGAQPAAGVPVLFSAGDGSMQAVVMTDAMGVAEADVGRDSIATVVRSPFDDVDVDTIVGVQPGDRFVIGDTWKARPTIATMRFTYSPAPIGHTYYYRLYTPCGEYDWLVTPNSSGSIPLKLDDRCAGRSFDAWLLKSHRVNPDLYFASKVTVPAAVDGGTVAMPDPSLEPVPVMLSYTGAPAGYDISAIVSVANADGWWFSDYDDAFQPGVIPLEIPPSDPTMRRESISVQAEGSLAYRSIARRGAFTATPSFDLAGLPPEITSVSFDESSRQIRWTAAGAAPSDMVVTWLFSEAVDGRSLSWRVLAPGTSTSSTRLPTLPSSLSFADLGVGERRVFVGLYDVPGADPALVRQSAPTWLVPDYFWAHVEWDDLPASITEIRTNGYLIPR